MFYSLIGRIWGSEPRDLGSNPNKTTMNICPKNYISTWEHTEAQELHYCPYEEELRDDKESLGMCMCCAACERECYMDI